MDGAFSHHSSLFCHFSGVYSSLFCQKRGYYSSLFYHFLVVYSSLFYQKVVSLHAEVLYFFYIRPRRFGKTLPISMLENYYDINKQEDFENIFGKLYIGQNPTPEHNKYLVLHLNFAEIVGGLEDYQQGMDDYCNIRFNFFVDVYEHLLPEGTKEG